MPRIRTVVAVVVGLLLLLGMSTLFSPTPSATAYEMTPWETARAERLEPRASEWRLTIVREKDPHCKTYHVYALVTSSGTAAFNGPGANPYEGGLVPELFATRGITYLSLKPYQVSVCKAQVYRWAELEPQIVATLERNLIKK